MRSIVPRLLFSVCLAGWAGTAAVAADEPPSCPLKVVARLPMFTLNRGLVAIPVTLEDHELFFLVDTGGFSNTISQDVADQLKLTPQQARAKIYGVGQTMDTFVTPKSFSIGPMSGKDMHFSVEPLTVPGIAGALGPDTMRDFDVDFDFAQAKFGIFSSDHCPGKVVYWTKDAPIVLPMSVDNNGHVHFAVTLDGKPVHAVLDTGSDTSIMSQASAKQFLGIDETTPGLEEHDVMINRARHKTYLYPFRALSIGELPVSQPAILILQDEDMAQMGSDLVLGMNVLRQMHIYIAYGEQKLYLTPATAQ